MTEAPLFLGSDERMLGIVARPKEGGSHQDEPVALLINAGLVHRVGPNRLNVNIARALANRGFASIRFDMSGIGDSQRAMDEKPYVDQSVEDISDAMDSYQRSAGAGKYVIIGLCTGAYNALEAASADDRVVGCVLIDGYAYPTTRFTVTHQTKRFLQLWRWKRYLRRRLRLDTAEPKIQPDDVLVFQPKDMQKDEFAARINALTDRGTAVQFVYTGYGPQPYSYERQLRDAFPDFDRNLTSVVYLPEATHTFTLPTHRQELVDSISEWMRANFSNGDRK
jgi:pimeloyl-ACP methyl ester carboxylesterase